MSSARPGYPPNAKPRIFDRKFGVVMEAREDARPRPQRPRRLEVRRYSTLKSVAPDHPDTRALGVGGSAVSWPALTCCRVPALASSFDSLGGGLHVPAHCVVFR